MHIARTRRKTSITVLTLLAGALLLFAIQPAVAQTVEADAEVTICLDLLTQVVAADTLEASLDAGATIGSCAAPEGETPVNETAEGPGGEEPLVQEPDGSETDVSDPVQQVQADTTLSADCDGPLTLDARTEGETNVLDWDLVTGAEAYIVYRAIVGGELEQLATVNSTTEAYVDADVVVGTTYEYVVTAVVDGVESSVCALVEVTAVPVFANVVAAGLAGLAGIGAYTLRRRR